MTTYNERKRHYQERGHGRPLGRHTQAEAQAALERLTAAGCITWPEYDPATETQDEYLARIRAGKGA